MTRPVVSPTVRLATVAGGATTAAILAVGMWARAVTGDVWPTILTDWTLGSVLLAVSATGVGCVIVRRQPHNAVGWLFLGTGVGTAVVFGIREYTEMILRAEGATQPALWGALLFTATIPANMAVLGLLTLLFPYGSPPSPRWRPVVTGIAALGAGAVLAAALSPYAADQSPFADLPNPLAVLPPDLGAAAVETTSLGIIAGWLLCALALVRRLRRAHGVERQQVKWFVFAVSCAFLTFFPGFWIEPLFIFATLIGFPAIPVAAGIAILRYRLYDIDRLINRTVVYGAVTAVLALAYLVAVTAMQALTAPLAGDTALAVAASTLAVAALFQPLRRRIQSAVDRRFNRARYDATATVERLRLRLRDEVDLDALKAELITAARVTMQPAGAALWLREAKQ